MNVWSRKEAYSYVLGCNTVEYHIGGRCFVRGNYVRFGGNKVAKQDGWDVLNVEKREGISIIKVAWFRELRDAQIWAELLNRK